MCQKALRCHTGIALTVANGFSILFPKRYLAPGKLGGAPGKQTQPARLHAALLINSGIIYRSSSAAMTFKLPSTATMSLMQCPTISFGKHW